MDTFHERVRLLLYRSVRMSMTRISAVGFLSRRRVFPLLDLSFRRKIITPVASVVGRAKLAALLLLVEMTSRAKQSSFVHDADMRVSITQLRTARQGIPFACLSVLPSVCHALLF